MVWKTEFSLNILYRFYCITKCYSIKSLLEVTQYFLRQMHHSSFNKSFTIVLGGCIRYCAV